ncbi:[citrate (pro-3S)-lyase] ligase [Clostridium perfringens]|nr:[citrate (pro-3S)-lyase] ligase [Clostridium perfringens]BDA29700.1 [Citrate [pro-3S]-lyase] ligase [Clostridium perfringens]HCG3172737.1 [citrate (pro-3S)-lyase] ligase [Clostridium perfringens]
MSEWNYENTFEEELTFFSFNPQINKKYKFQVEEFLKKENLRFVKSINFTVCVFNNKELIATGSLDGYILKCFAIRNDYRKKGISEKILRILTEKAFENGETHLFIYTKPKNSKLFESLGYHQLINIPNLVSLLENKSTGIRTYIRNLQKESYLQGEKIASIVMNCNPFTKGHKYLIEKASKENDIVHLFILTEDKSEFSTEDRINMVKLGTKHLKNVLIHEAGKYIISSATFPSYFIKEQKNTTKAHAYLDLTLFCEYISKALNIKYRYVGEEPFSNLTNEYNQYMKEILPKYNIQVIEVKRLKEDGQAISASNVRSLLKEGSLEKVGSLVPKTTFDYLLNISKK